MAAMAAKSGYDSKLMLQPYVWTQQLQSEKVTLARGLERIRSAFFRHAFIVAVADPVRSKVVSKKVTDSRTCRSGSSCTLF